MALAKKGSRTIVVGGVTYRWKIDANDEPGLGVVVELADAPAQRAVTWVDHGNVVAPALVRHFIECPLDQGWKPAERGEELRFQSDGTVESRPKAF